jgi:hypothetical protein
MAYPLPSVQTTSTSVPNYRKYGIKPGEAVADVVLDSTVADSAGGHTPTFQIRPGSVVVYSTGKAAFVLATDYTNADAVTPASVLSATGITTSWNGVVITVTVGGLSKAVTIGSANTNAGTVSDLNTAFAAAAFPAVADVSASAVRIRSFVGGTLHVSSTYANTFGTAVSVATGRSIDPAVRVLEDFAYTQDINGAAINAPCKATRSGSFVAANLLNSTPEALALLVKQGATLY